MERGDSNAIAQQEVPLQQQQETVAAKGSSKLLGTWNPLSGISGWWGGSNKTQSQKETQQEISSSTTTSLPSSEVCTFRPFASPSPSNISNNAYAGHCGHYWRQRWTSTGSSLIRPKVLLLSLINTNVPHCTAFSLTHIHLWFTSETQEKETEGEEGTVVQLDQQQQQQQQGVSQKMLELFQRPQWWPTNMGIQNRLQDLKYVFISKETYNHPSSLCACTALLVWLTIYLSALLCMFGSLSETRR